MTKKQNKSIVRRKVRRALNSTRAFMKASGSFLHHIHYGTGLGRTTAKRYNGDDD